MKLFGLALFFSASTHALTSFPLQFGLGYEFCHPNKDGLTECAGASPTTKELKLELEVAPESEVSYGFHSQSGTFQKLGYEASVKVEHFEREKIDDMITVKLITWDLQKPDVRYETTTEIFARGPENLNRVNVIGHAIGTDEDYTNLIASVRKSEKN